MKKTALCLLSFLVPCIMLAQPVVDTNYFLTALKTTPAAELPDTAAWLVRQSTDPQRMVTVTNVVSLAIRLSPGATLGIVSAVSKETPELTASIAAVAATEQPIMADEIARVATVTSPSRAGEIVERVGNSAPSELRSVILAVSRGAPIANLEILRAVEVVRPELKPYLELEVARCGRSLPPVARCFDRASRAHLAASRQSNGKENAQPATRPDPKPPHAGGGPPGGRNYAKP